MYLLVITIVLVLASFFFDRHKTVRALRIAVKKFLNICIPLFVVLIIVSFVLYFIPSELISETLSDGNRYAGMIIASIIGSVTMVPGFIAFPLSGILRQNNVPYMVISAFTTTLMMVGILTFPIEQKYFGTRVALIRNTISFGTALAVALITGLFFGEVFV